LEPLLEIKDLSGGYGKVTILREVFLVVNELEVVCVLGANGAGKTTLLNTVAGILRPSKGEIFFRQQKVTGMRPESLAARGLSLVMQGRSIFPFMTVQENIDMGAYLLKDPSALRSRLDEVLQMFPILATRKTQLAGSMSGGEQKMLELARVLMLQPKLLMLDEPSLGLAPLVINMILDRISEFRKQGMTILLVEQSVSKALDICTRGYLLEMGRIQLAGTREELLNNPKISQFYLGIA
jgi:branched-chain amino acid transport system ATP-binding protein